METELHSKDSDGRSEIEGQETQKARSPIESDEQAFLGMTNRTELYLRGEISMGLLAFVSRNPDASYDTSFSSTERPATPTVEPISSEGMCRRAVMRINSVGTGPESNRPR